VFAAPLRSYTAVLRYRCAAALLRRCAVLSLLPCAAVPLCRGATAPPLRHRCAAAAPLLRHRCATAAPSLRHRCATAAPLRRSAVVLLCRRVTVPQARAAAVPLWLPTSVFIAMTSRLQLQSLRHFVDNIAPLMSTAATNDPKHPSRPR